MPGLIQKIKEEVTEEVMSRSKSAEKSAVHEQKVVHPHIICDSCQTKDIQGVRYKCAVCADFDLCEKCEAVVQHAHPFLKIKHPKQAPIKIFTIIDDQEDSFEINGAKQSDSTFNGLIQQGFKIAQEFLSQTVSDSKNESNVEENKEEVT